MKRLLTLALVLVPLLSMAQDDLYFTSSKKAKEAAQKRATASMTARTTTVAAPTVVDYHSNTRGEDEYNRRYVYGGQYAEDSLAARIDTVDDAQPRYDMNDPELDYRFSRRLVRFHSPRLYALTSPYYWDLYYGYGAWDYLYDPWDPWYWHYGWSYGWTWGPWDCWYGSIWGWSHPYSWSYWGWGPGWSRPIYYASYYRNSVPRDFNSARGHMAAGNRIRTNAVGGRNLNTRTSALNSRTGIVSGRTNAERTRTSAQAARTVNTRTGGTSYTDYTNARTGRTATSTNQGARTQVYNATREGAARRSTITNGVNMPTRSYSNQNSSSRTSAVQQPQTRMQVQPQTRTQVQQQTRTQVQQQTQTRQVQQPTRTYTPTTTTTRTSSGGFGGGASIGGGSRGGGSFGGGGGGGRSGGGRR